MEDKRKFVWYDESAKGKYSTCVNKATGELFDMHTGEVVGKIENYKAGGNR